MNKGKNDKQMKEENILHIKDKISDDSLEKVAGGSGFYVCRYCGCPLWSSSNQGYTNQCPNPECGKFQ